MLFRQLTVFLQVCASGSMTQAAKELYISQPSVSQAVAELEQFYGVRLFERLNHHLFLTPAGERLREYARQILSLAEETQQALAEYESGGVLRIGSSMTIGVHLLPGLVARFQAAMPGVEVFTVVDNTQLIAERIMENQLDLALVEGPVHEPHLVEEDWRADELAIISSPRHPLALKENLSAADLSGSGFLMRENGSGTREVFENAMRAAGISWHSTGVFNNNDAIKNAVRSNLGISVMSKIVVAEEMQAGQIAALDVEGLALQRTFHWVYHRQKYFTRAMLTFKELAAQGA